MKYILILLLFGCSSVKKTTRIEETHKDSVAVKTEIKKADTFSDSTNKKQSKDSVVTETVITYVPVYINVKGKDSIIYVPKIVTRIVKVLTQSEEGKLTKTDKTETVKKDSVKVVSDSKVVNKTKVKSSFSWWWLLWLLPVLLIASFIYKPTREWWWDKLGWAVSKFI